jgi:hypothetical protein
MRNSSWSAIPVLSLAILGMLVGAGQAKAGIVLTGPASDTITEGTPAVTALTYTLQNTDPDNTVGQLKASVMKIGDTVGDGKDQAFAMVPEPTLIDLNFAGKKGDTLTFIVEYFTDPNDSSKDMDFGSTTFLVSVSGASDLGPVNAIPLATTVTVQDTPEPSSIVLSGIFGVIATAFAWRRRAKLAA